MIEVLAAMEALNSAIERRTAEIDRIREEIKALQALKRSADDDRTRACLKEDIELLQQQYNRLEDARTKLEEGLAAAAARQPPAAQPNPEGPAMRTYTVRHGRSKHDFVQPVNLSFGHLMQLIDQHWVLLRATEYQVFYQDQDQPLIESSWTKLLRNMQDTAPLTLRAKTIGKPFSMYITKDELELRKIAETYLRVTLLDAMGSPCVQDELFPELQVGDDFTIEGATFSQRIKALVMQLTSSASAMAGVLDSKEASQRDFISPVLTLSLLLARVKGSHGTSLRLAVEYNVVGKRAWGPVDYVLLYHTLGVMVAEAKRYNPSEAWAQVYMQLSSLRDALLRSLTGQADKKRSHYEACELQHMPTYAVVATATDYRLLAYTPPGSGNDAALSASSPQTLPLSNPQTDPTPAIRSLVCKLAGIMCRQAEEIDRVMVSLGLRKKLGILPNILPGEDNDLQQQELDAARDHEDSENKGEEVA